MRKLLETISLLSMLAGALLLFQQPAYGYTDPGTGLLAIQAVGSALVAAGWYLRRRIYSLFHRGATGKPAQAALEDAHERKDWDDKGSRLP